MTAEPIPRLLFLELNEVNFDYLCRYAKQGLLPTFGRLLDARGYALTESEDAYEKLEPWIQWVTAHTGQPLAQHRVFRLGDIVNSDIPQIWEKLEDRGLRVGAVSPMNAKNRLREPAFFVPDPWTPTKVHAGDTLKRLYEAIVQVVNDNASSHVTWRSMLNLLRGFVAYAAPGNWPLYVKLAASARRHPWRKAMFLDLLLADVFMSEVRRTQPHFSTLFVNAAAHIQHHYLFCSSVYEGESRNPEWYVRPGIDPILEVYQLYDRIVARALAAFPSARLMLGTGLHQNPHPSVTFYWRLLDHATFLRGLGVRFASVMPLMSRDFLITCASPEEARVAEQRLKTVFAMDGVELFEVDNRGNDLFVMLTYPKDIDAGTTFRVDGDGPRPLREHVAFVALKNGEHHGVGYFFDSGRRFDPAASPIPLMTIPDLVMEALLGPAQASSHS
jgi:hypothetical protein